MRLERLSVANFRGIPDFDIEVRRHLVLVGPNESGKSSVLYALHLLLGTAPSQLATAFTERDFSDPSKRIDFTARLVEFTDDERAAFPDEIAVNPERLVVKLEAELDAAVSGEISVQRWFPDSGHLHGPTAEQRRAFGWQLVGARRSLERELGPGRASALRTILGQLDLAEDEEKIKAAIENLKTAVTFATAIEDFRAELATALSSALPRDVDSQQVALTPPGSLDEPLSGVTLAITEHGRTVPMLEQSDGVQALSTMAVFGMAHKGANIVGIDEPEMHLHPTAQAAIGRLLAEGGGQRLVATQSSLVAARFLPQDLLALGRTRSPCQLPSGAPALEERFLARWWTHQVIEPLSADAVAVVEGPSERLILESACRALSVRPERLDVAIVELDGADSFHVAYRILGSAGFGLRLIGLVDKDHEEQWASEMGIGAGDLAKHGILVAVPDLEGEYVAGLGAARVVQLLDASPFFTQAKVVSGCRAANVAGIKTPALAEFCRHKRRKIMAAAAVAAGITAAEVPSLPGVNGLIQEIERV